MNDKIKGAISFLITAGIFGLGSLLAYLSMGQDGYFILLPMIFSIPYGIAGIITWACLRIKNKPVALGILFGSLVPFASIFFLTGGCGLW